MTSVGAANSAPVGTSFSTASTRTGSGKTSGAAGSNALGKDDFMKLLLAQLQHQDPLKPMDDQAFIAQTAQFNALEQMQTLNKTLASVLSSQQLTEANGLIGKTIRAATADGKPVVGVVTGVSVESGVAKLHVGDTTVDLSTIVAVASSEGALPSVAAPVPAATNTKSVNASA
jgi:flagellar basal-body rod modification protein FlgD